MANKRSADTQDEVVKEGETAQKPTIFKFPNVQAPPFIHAGFNVIIFIINAPNKSDESDDEEHDGDEEEHEPPKIVNNEKDYCRMVHFPPNSLTQDLHKYLFTCPSIMRWNHSDAFVFYKMFVESLAHYREYDYTTAEIEEIQVLPYDAPTGVLSDLEDIKHPVVLENTPILTRIYTYVFD